MARIYFLHTHSINGDLGFYIESLCFINQRKRFHVFLKFPGRSTNILFELFTDNAYKYIRHSTSKIDAHSTKR